MQKKKFKLKIKKETLALIDWANVYGWRKKLKWEVCPKKLFSFLSRYPRIIDKRFYYGEDIKNKKSKNFRMDIEKIGYSPIFKEVKWMPVYLKEQNHFRKIIKKLFNMLDGITKTNSEISNKLYEFNNKVKNGMIEREESSVDENGEEKKYYLISRKNMNIYNQIYQFVENLDSELSGLNFNIDGLQKSLKEPCPIRKCDFDVEITRDAFNFLDDYETLLLFSGDGDYSALAEYLIEKGKKVVLVFGSGCKGKEYNKIRGSLFYACSVDNLRKELEKMDVEEESSMSMSISMDESIERD